MTGPHPRKIEDGPVKNAVKAVKKIFSKGITLVRSVRHKYLLIKDGSASVVDYEDLPEDKQEQYRFDDRREKLSRGGEELMQNARYDTYSGQSASKIAGRASDNPQILSDILDDPGLVDAEGSSEAVAKVAEQNPSWAKISDAVEAHGLEADADGNVSEAGGTGDGDSGGIETADAGDLGPSTPADYGMNVAGGDSGGSGDAGGDVGGDAGGSAGSGDGGGLGGDVGGGDL